MLKQILFIFLFILSLSFLNATSEKFNSLNCYQNQTLENATCEQILCDYIKTDSSTELSYMLVDANLRLSSNLTYYKEEYNNCKKTNSAMVYILCIVVAVFLIMIVRFYRLRDGD